MLSIVSLDGACLHHERGESHLKCGGVFITCDCDWPPTVAFEAENAYLNLISGAKEILKRHPDGKRSAKRWDKSKHLENIRKSGYFRYTKEILLHHREYGNAKRFINLALSRDTFRICLREVFRGRSCV